MRDTSRHDNYVPRQLPPKEPVDSEEGQMIPLPDGKEVFLTKNLLDKLLRYSKILDTSPEKRNREDVAFVQECNEDPELQDLILVTLPMKLPRVKIEIPASHWDAYTVWKVFKVEVNSAGFPAVSLKRLQKTAMRGTFEDMLQVCSKYADICKV